MKVRVYIFQCKNLPPSDSNGLSDPFIKLWDKNKKCPNTKIIDNTLNPIYYCARDVTIDVISDKDIKTNQLDKFIRNFQPIILDIRDDDQIIGIGSSEFLCRAKIFPYEASAKYLNREGLVLWESEHAINNKQEDHDQALKNLR